MLQCIICNKPMKGRADKKFCSKKCSNENQRERKKVEVTPEVKTINYILLKNRTILDNLLQGTKEKQVEIFKIVLVQLGFNFEYITGYYLNSKNKVYHYVYDYAWMEFSTQKVLVVKK